MYSTSTLSLLRLVTLPPELYKARQGPITSSNLLSYYSRRTIAPSCNRALSIQSYAANRT
jgi:hypothetical protein